MVEKEYEPDDPIEMVGMEIPHQGEEQLRDMALCFAEEFVREGWGEEQLMTLFKNAFYHGPHLVWKQKGDEYVRSVILEAMRMWRPYHREGAINRAKSALPEAGGSRPVPSKQMVMQKNEREGQHGPGL